MATPTPFDLPSAIRRSGRSDEELAVAVGCSKSYVCRLRRGQRQPSLEVLWKLACLLGEFELARTLAPISQRVAS